MQELRFRDHFVLRPERARWLALLSRALDLLAVQGQMPRLLAWTRVHRRSW
jgi:hypothetical protein